VTTKTIDLPIYDPWVATAPTFTHSADPDAQPPNWHRLSLASRDRLGGLLAHVLATTPHNGPRDVYRLVSVAQGALRATYQPLDEMGVDAPTKEKLVGLYVSDPVERERYRVTEAELTDPRIDPSFLLESAIRKLLGAGDVVATLDARISALQAQRARMVKLSAGQKAAAR